MLDSIGSSNIFQGNLTSFTSDRFGCPNSALNLNGGWTQVPNGIYFETPEFTIASWVLLEKPQVDWGARLLDFGNGAFADNIIISFKLGALIQPAFQLYSGPLLSISTTSSQTLSLNQWQFLAITFNRTHLYIYLDGELTSKAQFAYTIPALSRSKCYFGRSNWAIDGYSSSYLDDIRFYSKSLTQNEIIQVMNDNSTG